MKEKEKEIEELKEEIEKLRNEQEPKDIEFNNLCDDYNNLKDECDKLKDENDKLKKDLDDIVGEEQKKDEEYNQLVDDINKLQEENDNLKKENESLKKGEPTETIEKENNVESPINKEEFDKLKEDNEDREEKDKLIYNNINNYYKNEYDNNYFCELKIVYCDLNLSHRFIRFQSSIEYNKLYNIIKNNYIDKDIGIISFQFQRDDEIENNNSNNSISSEIKYIFNKMKNEKLINLDKLSQSYTLGLVYDYNKNENIKQLKDKIELNNINNKENIGPFAGIKNINSKEILNSDFEIILSKWIIDFYEIYNNFLEIKENKGTIDTISFFELRPKYLNI